GGGAVGGGGGGRKRSARQTVQAGGSWDLPGSTAGLAGKLRFQTDSNGRWNEWRYVAADGCDLPHQCGADRADDRRGRQKNRLHGGRHGGVHARHFYLVVEIGRAAQPADDERRALALGGGHDEITKGDAGEITTAGARECAAGLLDHGAALLGVEQGRLAGMGADREHEPIGEPGGLAHEVEMAVSDGIERSRKKRGPRHGGGLAR